MSALSTINIKDDLDGEIASDPNGPAGHLPKGDPAAPIVRLPAPTKASRIPAHHSKGSHRGRLLNTKTNRSLVYESKLEADVALVTLMRREVVDLWDQPPAVSYRDEDGVWRKHTMDYLAVLDDGRRIAMMVKPEAAVERRRLEALVKRIARQIPRAFATHVVIVSERDVPRATLADAKLVHAVRRIPEGPADILVTGMVAALRGRVAISEIVAASGMGGAAFQAVVRLVDTGTLRVVHGARLGYATVVARADAQSGEAA